MMHAFYVSASRIGVLIRQNAHRFTIQRTLPFSSSPSATNLRYCFFSDDAEEGSSVYRHALKFQAPTTVDLRSQKNLLPMNSVSLIGFVDTPLQVYDNKNGHFKAYTILRVKDPRDHSRTFRILLNMWNELAKQCVAHLRPNNFIYVSGRLESYTKSDETGNLSFRYKVTANELKYVSQPGQSSTICEPEETQSGAEVNETGMDECEDRLYLWQVFFSNPYEWWDNRKSKLNPNQPDFKHKDTGEALWLSPKDPAWIKQQLQLLDSRMEGQNLGELLRPRSRVSNWIYDE